jgi:molybdenum cofactor biosynthesis protein MoaC
MSDEPTSDARKHAHMADVRHKIVTARRAVATGSIVMERAVFTRLARGELKKGDPLKLAEYAGITGAKRTSEWVPLCHPLPLEHVRVECTLDEAAASVHVEVEVQTTAKTGVEMEALTGASAALLALYDVLKAEDGALEITGIKLTLKTGGKSEQNTALAGLRVAVITVSDRVSRKEAEDRSGPTLRAEIERRGGSVVHAMLVPDELGQIAAAYKDCAARADIVISTGGTGLSPRDVTPEALTEACTRLLPGLGEAFRARSSAFTHKAWLSRAAAGLIGGTLVLALPGSPRAVAEGMLAVGDLLAHAVHTARGGGH